MISFDVKRKSEDISDYCDRFIDGPDYYILFTYHVSRKRQAVWSVTVKKMVISCRLGGGGV